AIFNEAVDRPTIERAALVDEACGSDTELAVEVRSLLDAYAGAGDFLEPLPPSDDSEPGPPGRAGERLGPYTIVKLLGAGGMSEVYLARRSDGQFEQDVAIKIVKRGTDTALVLERFRAERAILARLRHPNVTRILDAGTTDDGLPYFVMNAVAGTPLDAY